MIRVTVGTNTSRETIIVQESATPKQVLTQAGARFETATIHLDGAVLKVDEMNKPLSELGVSESCTLIAVTKTDNA